MLKWVAWEYGEVLEILNFYHMYKNKHSFWYGTQFCLKCYCISILNLCTLILLAWLKWLNEESFLLERWTFRTRKAFFLTLNFWGFYHLRFLLPVLVAFRLMNWLVFLLIYLCTNECFVKLWVIFKYVRLCWNHGNRNLLLFIWISRYSFLSSAK